MGLYENYNYKTINIVIWKKIMQLNESDDENVTICIRINIINDNATNNYYYKKC